MEEYSEATAVTVGTKCYMHDEPSEWIPSASPLLSVLVSFITRMMIPKTRVQSTNNLDGAYVRVTSSSAARPSLRNGPRNSEISSCLEVVDNEQAY